MDWKLFETTLFREPTYRCTEAKQFYIYNAVAHRYSNLYWLN